MCFVLGENLFDSTTEMKIWLSFKTLQKTSGFVRCISKINYISFVTSIKIIMLLIACINAIYYAYVVFKVISVYKLLYHNTGHPAYVITYPVCNMKFSALSASS